MDKFKLTN